MKILFSPSEGKHSGGNLTYNNTLYLFETLKDKHLDVLTQYQNYITNCDDEKLGKLFGLKKATDIQRYKSIDILNALKCKAVERYNGVAYDYLAYDTLSDTEKSFIDQNLIIFSNLYGPISANYPIAEYKLKQGEKIGNFAIEKFYKEHFSQAIDTILDDEFIIDLRAGFYLKFYTLKIPHITLKFYKGDKVVSHWAKAYRGKVVKALAKHQPQNEVAFQKIEFDNLQIREIIKRKQSSEYIFDII